VYRELIAAAVTFKPLIALPLRLYRFKFGVFCISKKKTMGKQYIAAA
jgi:hypothetical protein